MEGKAKGAIVIVVLLAVGVIAGYLVGTLKFPPADHKAIAEAHMMVDITENVPLKLRFERRGKASLSRRALATFVVGKEYKYSFWTWSREAFPGTGEDVNVAMWIWGPDETGTYYHIKLGKMAGHDIEVTLPDGSKIVLTGYTGWDVMQT